MTLYPAKIDNNTSLPDVIDSVTTISGASINRLKEAILAIEAELGIHPSSVYGTVRSRLDAIEEFININHIEVPGGSLGGTSLSAATVVQVDGDSITGILPIIATIQRAASGSTFPTTSVEAGVTTHNATTTTVLTFPAIDFPPNSNIDFICTVVGRDLGTGLSGSAGDFYRNDIRGSFKRVGTAAPVAVSAPVAGLALTDGAAGTYGGPSMAVSGNTIVLQVTGAASTDVIWNGFIQGQKV